MQQGWLKNSIVLRANQIKAVISVNSSPVTAAQCKLEKN